MEWHSEIFRFQEGVRIQHAAPEVAVESALAGAPSEAAELLMVLVDLSPALPHRSREIRAAAVEAYRTSTGSTVARLRRALAEANRHLVVANARSNPEQNASGSISCVVFREEELFLGQAGAGHALLCHADETIEAFPQATDPIMPLGAVSPPVINISYAPLLPEDTLFVATSGVAEVYSDADWSAILSSPTAQQSVDQVVEVMKTNSVTGSAGLVRCLADPLSLSEEPTSQRWRLSSVLRRKEKASESSPKPVDGEHLVSMPVETVTSGASPAAEPAPVVESSVLPVSHVSDWVEHEDVESSVPPEVAAVDVSDNALSAPVVSSGAVEDEEALGPADEKPARSNVQLPEVHLPQIGLLWDGLRRLFGKISKVPFKSLLKVFLPGKVGSEQRRSLRYILDEKATVMGGASLGVVLIVAFITLTTYLQFGGALSAEVVLEEASVAWDSAYASQSPQDWARALELAERALTLDPQNTEARVLRDEAQLAMDALEQSAMLSATPIIELGTAPSPRHLLVADSWVYILNTAADEVFGFPLSEDGIIPLSAAPTPILKRGQVLFGEPVGDLVDFAWVEPGPGYPDGAIFIYSDYGILYVYEPSLGPGSITSQSLQGDLEPGTVTLIETFNGNLYLVNRQENQIFKYASINGAYDGPGRPYFAPESVPQLQTALNMSLDGRLYLLLGDGTVGTYFNGSDDLSFEIQGLPDPDFHPTVMAVEGSTEEGYIYLGDPKHERIFVLDAHGYFLHQYRLPGDALKHLEVLAIGESPRVLYLIAENRLYAAAVPELAP